MMNQLISEMKKLYEDNEGFKQYVDRYCVKENVLIEIALTHSVVKNAFEYYKHVEDGKLSVSEIKAGCNGAASGGDCK